MYQSRKSVLHCLAFCVWLVSAGGEGVAKRGGRYTLADAAGNIGIAILLLIALAQLVRLLGGALLRQVFLRGGGVPEWAAGLLNLLCIIVPFLCALLFLHRRSKAYWHRPPAIKTKPPVWILLALFLGCMVAMNFVTALIESVASWITQQPRGGQTALPVSASGKLLYFCAVCLASPLFEELFFRGAVQKMLRPWGAWLAIATTAILFALMHGSLFDLPAILVLSLLLGYVAEIAGSVWYSVLLHFVNNTYVFCTMLLAEQVVHVSSLVLAFGTVVVFIILFLAAVWVIRKRNMAAQFALQKDLPEKLGRKRRVRRMLETPSFAAGVFATVVYFVLRAFVW